MTDNNHEPRSWAQDLQSYRETRGCKSFSTLSSQAHAPLRYAGRPGTSKIARPLVLYIAQYNEQCTKAAALYMFLWP